MRGLLVLLTLLTALPVVKPTTCLPGTFRDSSACEQCGAGSFSITTNATACIPKL